MNSRDEEAGGRGQDPRMRSIDGKDCRTLTAVAGLVFAASVVPVPTVPGTGRGMLPIIPAWIALTAPFHLIGYAALAVLTVRAVAGRERATVGATAVGVAAATAFGFGVELVQAPIPWRSFAWSDVAINAVGATVGAGLFSAWRTVRKNGNRDRFR
ncbi:VanZ family protein [Halorubrum sp. RMP-47]|uniref:VanZ family protein n=1 Tax=Halorubrum miltondacostae TaxID=3076378 RepID=A0ABD5M7B0_9EURY